MATEEQKKANMLRLTRLSLFGLTTGVWDLLGEGSFGLSHEIGDEILPVLEKEMGLEIAGEDPEDILHEFGRIMVDEFGFANEVEVSGDGNMITMKVRGCKNVHFAESLAEAGVTHPFICPFMNVSDALFDRMGVKAMSEVEMWPEGNGSIITFELI